MALPLFMTLAVLLLPLQAHSGSTHCEVQSHKGLGVQGDVKGIRGLERGPQGRNELEWVGW